MSSFQVPHEMSLLEALQKFFPDSSKRTLLQWVKYGRIYIDNEQVKNEKTVLSPGAELSLGEKKQVLYFKGIKILYHDRALVVIDKPEHLLSVPSNNPEQPHALGLLRQYFSTPSIFAVHRLDKETSGVMIFARGTLALDYFDALFEKHDLIREYYAIVEGHLYPEKGTWQSYLIEKENYDVAVTSAEKGKLAITHFEVLRRSKKFSYLKCRLETGRKHQIRVHCKEAGHPVIGDERYHSLANPLKRLGLHAAFLSFVHPLTKKQLSFFSPPPRSFKTLGFPAQKY